MQTLLNFIIKHNHWFLFLVLEGIGVMLIAQFNNYQSATLFTSANSVAGNIFATMTDVGSYFNLKSENEKLLQHNCELNQEVAELKEQLATISDSITIEQLRKQNKSDLHYNTATVINNSLNKVNNYITLDKGTDDGLSPGMGVFCEAGVVGIVYETSPNFSIVIPLLNSKSNISCRVKGDDNFSSLQWKSGDVQYSYLIDLPRYAKLEKGDTVVTSGFSSIFPKDLPIGTIEEKEESANDMFYSARVKLFTDFSTLTKVYIVGNKGQKEQKELEKKSTSDK